MGIDGVDATIADQPDQVQGATRAGQADAEFAKRWEIEERSGTDALRYPDQVLHDDSARAEVEMADFAVAHLPGGQPDGKAARVEERARRRVPDLVPDRGPSEFDRVVSGVAAIAPAVEDDQCDRGGMV